MPSAVVFSPSPPSPPGPAFYCDPVNGCFVPVRSAPNFNNSAIDSTLPKDPRLWGRDDVACWLQNVSTVHGLPPIPLDRFFMNGKALCLMTIDMFVQRVPLGGKLLYKDFQLRLFSAMYNREVDNYKQSLPGIFEPTPTPNAIPRRSTIWDGPHVFEIIVDVHDFSAKEISVQFVDDGLAVEVKGQHISGKVNDENEVLTSLVRVGQRGKVHSETCTFCERYSFPPSVALDTVKWKLTADQKSLIIYANKKPGTFHGHLSHNGGGNNTNTINTNSTGFITNNNNYNKSNFNGNVGTPLPPPHYNYLTNHMNSAYARNATNNGNQYFNYPGHAHYSYNRRFFK